MTKHDCIHATHSALISDILVAHRHPIGMSMCDQSAKILDEDNFLIWKVRKEIIVSRNDFNRTFSQFCNIFFVSFRIPKMDQLLKQVAKLLAVNTNYASMITTPTIHTNKLKFIQLSRVDVNQLLAVVVVEGNVIKNNIIHTAEELDDETLLKLNILLNTHLNGLALEEINLGMISSLKQQAGIHSEIVADVIDAIAESIHAEEDLEVYTSGANNIFRYPELADQQKASSIINTFEEKQLSFDWPEYSVTAPYWVGVYDENIKLEIMNGRLYFSRELISPVS